MTTTAVRERYPDGLDLPFADVRRLHLLKEDTSDWEPFVPVKLKGLKRCRFFDGLHADWKSCAICGVHQGHLNVLRIEMHHFPGGRRRSDERTAMIPLCSFWSGHGCHARVGEIGHAKLLCARYVLEPETVDWKRLHEIAGYWLPTPEPPPAGATFWQVGFETKRKRA